MQKNEKLALFLFCVKRGCIFLQFFDYKWLITNYTKYMYEFG